MHHTMVAPIFKYTYVDRFEGRGTPSDVQSLHLFQYQGNGLRLGVAAAAFSSVFVILMVVFNAVICTTPLQICTCLSDR